MTTQAIPWEFLRTASVQSLEDFELTRLNHVDLIHKQIRALIREAVSEESAANAARWRIEALRAELATPVQAELFGGKVERTDAA